MSFLNFFKKRQMEADCRRWWIDISVRLSRDRALSNEQFSEKLINEVGELLQSKYKISVEEAVRVLDRMAKKM